MILLPRGYQNKSLGVLPGSGSSEHAVIIFGANKDYRL